MNPRVEKNLRKLAKVCNAKLGMKNSVNDFAFLLILVEQMAGRLSDEELKELTEYILDNEITAEKLLKNYS